MFERYMTKRGVAAARYAVKDWLRVVTRAEIAMVKLEGGLQAKASTHYRLCLR